MKKRVVLYIVCILNCFSIAAQKINGICLVGPYEETVDASPFLEIKELHATWVAIVPEAFIDRATLDIKNNLDKNWTQNIEYYHELIDEAQKNNLKVFLKPHIIVKKNISGSDKLSKSVSWRGKIKPKNPQDWSVIEKNYSQYILDLAAIAEQKQVDMFCIGTELKSFIAQRPQYWKDLIAKLRIIYSGKITYSANWDNYENIPFWPSLDFIGMNCYFPINNTAIPSISHTRRNWKKIKKKIKKLSSATGKNVLVTEYGYRNVAYSGREPWLHDSGNSQSEFKNQTILLKALLESLWTENWIAGGFLWNWNYTSLPENNTDFSIQNKPAEIEIREWYFQYGKHF